MDSDQFNELCTLILAGEANKEEQDNFHRLLKDEHYHKQYLELKKIWEEASDLVEENTLDLVLNQVKSGIQKKEPQFTFEPQAKVRTLPSKNWLIAASILIGLTFIYGISQFQNLFSLPELVLEWNEVTTEPGQKAVIPLSDGSKITLAPGSTLKYPKTFGEGNRKVYLKGEAYLEVAKDWQRPFLVESPHSLTRVLGTQFNVYDFPEDSVAKVALVEGVVEVDSKTSGNLTQLSPGRMWIFDARHDIYVTMDFDPETVTGWKNDRFIFEDMSFKEVKPVLERHFGLEFQLEDKNIQQCKLTANITSKDLGLMLEGISYALNMKCERRGKVIYLQGTGCL